ATGTPVGAAGRGCVSFVGYDPGGYGNLVIITHRLGVVTMYAHLSSFSVHKGQCVTGHDRIGRVGSTGLSTGPHLHFEVLLPSVGSVAGRASTCPTGTAVSEGTTQLKATLARSTYGIDGSGVTVGVLSDSFDTLGGTPSPADDVASGDLPGATNTCGFT